MVAQVETNEGLLGFSNQAIDAAAQHAQRAADLTADVLDATGLFPNKPAYLPGKFLLELSAVLELGMWERQGLRDYLDALGINLPTFREAATDLAARAANSPHEFKGSDTPPLCYQVFRVWMEHFAWDGPSMLGAEIVLGQINEDQLADVLANFVWQHRHELIQFLTDPATTTTP